MVTIILFVEGGIGKNDPNALRFLTNNASIRRAFNTLFTKLLENIEVKIVVELVGSKTILNSINGFTPTSSYFWRDLDANIDKRMNVLEDIVKKNDLILKSNVFFMIQELESWIISQLDIMDIAFVDIDKTVIKHSLIRGTLPQNINNPSEKLRTLSRLFFKDKLNEGQPYLYQKLKNGFYFIQALNPFKLMEDFEDVNAFKLRIKGQEAL
jgi:hypothetical protein